MWHGVRCIFMQELSKVNDVIHRMSIFVIISPFLFPFRFLSPLSLLFSSLFNFYYPMATKQGDEDEQDIVFSRSQKSVIVAITVFTTAMLTALPINIYYPALSAMKEV